MVKTGDQCLSVPLPPKIVDVVVVILSLKNKYNIIKTKFIPISALVSMFHIKIQVVVL